MFFNNLINLIISINFLLKIEENVPFKNKKTSYKAIHVKHDLYSTWT